MYGQRSAAGVRRFLVGKAGPFPRVVFREEVFMQMDRFAQESPTGERGGFLVGRKRNLKSLEEYEILVEQFVPLASSRQAASRFALTQEDYHAVQRSLQASGSNLRIVGWMHSHPGFGVFLSAFDKQQHHRLFPRPWHIAYVIDAVHGDRALYHCVDHHWRKLPGYYILRADYGEEPASLRGPSRGWARMVAVLLLLLILGGAGVQGYRWYANRLTDAEGAPPEVIAEMQTETSQEEPVVKVTPGPAPTEVVLPPVGPRLHIVEHGESLWTIAEKYYGDATLYQLIVEANNISDPSRITAGITLVVPEKPSP